MKKILLFVLVLAVTSLTLSAQEAQQQTQPPATQQQGQPQPPAMTIQKPGPEMQRALEGTGRWKVNATFHKSEMMPEGGSDTGIGVFHPIAGGMAMVHEYHSDGKSPMGKFEGFEILWYDNMEKKFKSFWCDNMSPTSCMMSSSGNYQGDDLVMTGEMEFGGQKLQLRQVIHHTSPTAFTYTEEVNGKPSMTIQYTKIGDAPHGHDHAMTKDKTKKK